MKVQMPDVGAGPLALKMRGVWWLVSREDKTLDGQRRIDPVLGPDPLGILTYTSGHFAAQFMKRNRGDEAANQTFTAGQNNTSAVAGYDAYFGTYQVEEETGKTLHTLLGSVNPANIGISVWRHLKVVDDQLTIRLETTTPDGEPVTRTLTWRRLT